MAMLYQAADAYVSPYRAEGFNIRYWKRRLAASPLFCTRGGATDDFVTDASREELTSEKLSSRHKDEDISRVEPMSSI